MKYLLDTHVFLWSLFDTSKLTKSIKETILNEQNDIYVSTISFWEISLKFSIGKLTLQNIQPEELPSYSIKSGFEILKFDEFVDSSFHKLPRLSHSDPFDRMLIWQSITSDMTILSKDEKFKDYISHGVKLFWK